MLILLRKFKFLIIRILVPNILSCIFNFIPRRDKTLLIVKNDGIGDYILFRNFLHFLKNSSKYKHYKIYLLANLNTKDLAVYLDSETIDGFFWYSDSYFLKWKIVTLLLHLQKLRLDTIIYPNYSRKYSVDWLISNVKSKNKIAPSGNAINQSFESKQKTDKYYTELLEVGAQPLHEFERNKLIMEIIVDEKCHISQPFINKNALNITSNDSIIVFSGASNNGKKWSPSNFSKLCELIILKLNTKIILAGGKDDVSEGIEIMKEVSAIELSNQIGSLSLVELCELIGGSKLLISNDTVAVHIAVSLGIPCVCIAKGDLYGRFLPYPFSISNRTHSVFPRNLSANSKNQDQWSLLNIDEVLINDVYSAVVSALTNSRILAN